MRLAIAAICAISSFSLFAQYYNTLPKGVRTAVYRNVQTSEIDSTYNQNSTLNPISYDIEVNADSLNSIENESIQGVFEYVKGVNPEGFSKISAGAFKISGAATLNVDGYGIGWGITDRLTAYGSLPIYQANVKMKYTRTKQNNFEEVGDIYSSGSDNDLGQGLGNILGSIPDVLSGPTIQNMITEQYGYKEIGDWSGQGPGDLELGLMYNFLNRESYGLMLTGGAVAPTGRQDDPDILQDIAFGDGQWDAFMEFGGGYKLSNSLILNSFARYTHQFEAQKELRVPQSSDNATSSQKGSFLEKRGNKVLTNFNVDYIHNDWLNFNAAYISENIGKSRYESDFGDANEWLAANTNSSAQSIRLKAELSSVNSYMKQEFLLPAQIKFYYQSTLSGQNSPDVDRYEVEFRMFF